MGISISLCRLWLFHGGIAFVKLYRGPIKGLVNFLKKI
jgi:hypothetical protein